MLPAGSTMLINWVLCRHKWARLHLQYFSTYEKYLYWATWPLLHYVTQMYAKLLQPTHTCLKIYMFGMAVVPTQSCEGQHWPVQVPIIRQPASNSKTTSTGIIVMEGYEVRLHRLQQLYTRGITNRLWIHMCYGKSAVPSFRKSCNGRSVLNKLYI